jgi:chromosome segregation protein
VLGTVAALVRVEPGYQAAIAAALGATADAVAVTGVGPGGRRDPPAQGRRRRSRRLVVGGVAADTRAAAAGDRPARVPDGARAALDLVTVPDELLPAISVLLRDVVVVDGLDAARAAVAADAALVAVTTDGDVIGAATAAGGSARTPSLLEIQAAVDEVTARLEAATARGERLRFALAAADTERRDATARVEAALARLHESDARLAAVAEQLGQLGAAVRAAGAEADRLARAAAAADEALAGDRTALAELDARLAAAQDAPDEGEPSTDERDRLAAEGTAARQAEVDVRLAVRTGEERARALGGRAEALERAARQERDARERARARPRAAGARGRGARAVGQGAAIALTRIERSIAVAAEERAAAEQARAARDAELQGAAWADPCARRRARGARRLGAP